MRSESFPFPFFFFVFFLSTIPNTSFSQEATSCPGAAPDWEYWATSYVGRRLVSPRTVTFVKLRALTNCQGFQREANAGEVVERGDCSRSYNFSAQSPVNIPCKLKKLTIILDGGKAPDGSQNDDQRCVFEYDDYENLIFPDKCESIPGGQNDNLPYDYVSVRATGEMDMRESCTIKPVPFS